MNKRLTFSILSSLLIVSCQASLKDEFKSDTKSYKKVAADLIGNHWRYSKILNRDLYDCISLDKKDVTILQSYGNSHVADFLKKDDEIGLVMCDSVSVWFSKITSNKIASVEREILICSTLEKSAIYEGLKRRYLTVSEFQVVNKYWYFAKTDTYAE